MPSPEQLSTIAAQLGAFQCVRPGCEGLRFQAQRMMRANRPEPVTSLMHTIVCVGCQAQYLWNFDTETWEYFAPGRAVRLDETQYFESAKRMSTK